MTALMHPDPLWRRTPRVSSRLIRLMSEAGWVAGGQAIATVGSIVAIRVLTGILPPSGYGELALSLTAATLAQQLLMGPIGMGAIRYFALAVEGGQLGAYLKSTVLLVGASSLAIWVASALMGLYLRGSGRSEWLQLLWSASALAWLSSVSSLVDGIQNAARQRAIVAVHQGVGAWLRIALVVVIVKISGASSSKVLWGYAAGYALLLVSQTAFLFRTLSRIGFGSQPSASSSLHTAMWSYAWPFSTWGIFTWLQIASDRWALRAYSSVYQVGLYQSLYQLGFSPIALLTQFIQQVSIPIIFARAGNGDDQDRQLVAKRLNNMLLGATLVLTACGTLFSYAGGHRILALVVAPAYRTHFSLVTGLILAGGLFAAGQIACLNLMTALSTKRLIAPKIGTAAIGIGLNYAGAMFWGTTGVVAAQIAFSSIYLSWILYLTARRPGAGWMFRTRIVSVT